MGLGYINPVTGQIITMPICGSGSSNLSPEQQKAERYRRLQEMYKRNDDEYNKALMEKCEKEGKHCFDKPLTINDKAARQNSLDSSRHM
jgi:hypothetical protein